MKAKICYFILIALISSVICKADHPYRPFVKQGKRWVLNHTIYTISGDTVINDKSYAKVYRNTNKNDKYALGEYFAAVQEVDKVVYIIEKGTMNPEMLCNFNIIFDPNEVYSSNLSRKYTTETDSPMGLFHICTLYYTNGAIGLEPLIEGVGWHSDSFSRQRHNADYLNACYEDGQLLFHRNTLSCSCAKMADIEPDGMVDVHDLNAIVTVAGYFEPWYPHWVYNAMDVNCDIQWNKHDVDALVNKILGKEVIYFGGYPMTY